MRLVLLSLLLTVFSLPLVACGQTPTSFGEDATALSGHDQMKQRMTWQKNQAVYRVAFTVEMLSPRGKTTRWFAVERTPNQRLKMLSRTSSFDPQEVTFLEQEGAIVAIVGGKATQLVAPWVMGAYLFDEALSPEMMLAWTTGLAGKSYSQDYPQAQLHFDKKNLSSLSQNGWDVSFDAWERKQNTPLLPKKMTACKNNTCLNITVDDINVFAKAPPDYQEFSIF